MQVNAESREEDRGQVKKMGSKKKMVLQRSGKLRGYQRALSVVGSGAGFHKNKKIKK